MTWLIMGMTSPWLLSRVLYFFTVEKANNIQPLKPFLVFNSMYALFPFSHHVIYSHYLSYSCALLAALQSHVLRINSLLLLNDYPHFIKEKLRHREVRDPIQYQTTHQ